MSRNPNEKVINPSHEVLRRCNHPSGLIKPGGGIYVPPPPPPKPVVKDPLEEAFLFAVDFLKNTPRDRNSLPLEIRKRWQQISYRETHEIISKAIKAVRNG
jgi:hypothetical protein